MLQSSVQNSPNAVWLRTRSPSASRRLLVWLAEFACCHLSNTPQCSKKLSHALFERRNFWPALCCLLARANLDFAYHAELGQPVKLGCKSGMARGCGSRKGKGQTRE